MIQTNYTREIQIESKPIIFILDNHLQFEIEDEIRFDDRQSK